MNTDMEEKPKSHTNPMLSFKKVLEHGFNDSWFDDRTGGFTD